MTILGYLLIGGGLIAIGLAVASFWRSLRPPVRTPQYVQARERVDAVFDSAKALMDSVAAGRQRDQLPRGNSFGDWRDML